MFVKIFGLLACAAAFLINDSAYGKAVLECLDIYPGTGKDLSNPTKKDNCKLACEMRRMGTMAENGTYLVESVIANIPQNRSDRIFVIDSLRMCARAADDSDICSNADGIQDCILQFIQCNGTIDHIDWSCPIYLDNYLFNNGWDSVPSDEAQTARPLL